MRSMSTAWLHADLLLAGMLRIHSAAPLTMLSSMSQFCVMLVAVFCTVGCQGLHFADCTS